MVGAERKLSPRLLPLALLILIPIAPLWRAVFLGQAIGPFDQIRQMAPWNGPKPDVPWDVLQADGVLQFYPWRDMVLDAWGKHQLPLWNPYELAGTPLLADSQSAGFYPPHVLLGLLHVPTALAITLLAWFHLALAGLGAYFLSRTVGANRLGAFLGASSFSLSAFMVGWTALSSVITTVAWIPWALGFTVVIVSHRDSPSPRAWLGLALSVGMMLLGGHLQFAAYGFMAIAMLAIGQALVLTRGTSGGRSWSGVGFFAALALGCLLAASQIMPVLSYSKFSHRQNNPTAEGYSAYLTLALKPFELATVAYPAALGDPRTQIDAGNGTTLSQYWPYFVKPGANFAESAINIGPLMLAGLFLVPWKRRQLWPIAAVGVIALLMALGTALNMPLYYWVPGWSAGGSPGRIVVVFVLCACVLGGIGLGQIDEMRGPDWLKAGTGLAIGLLLAFWAPSLAPTPAAGADGVQQLRAAATTGMLPSLVTAFLLTLGALAVIGKYRPATAVFPILICLAGYGTNLLMTGKPLDPIQGVPPQDRVAFINNQWEIPLAADAIAPPNTASLSRIHELGGYDSLLHRDTVALLHGIDGTDPAPPANGNMMFIKPSADPHKLAEAGVTQTWARDTGEPKPLAGPSRCSVSNGTCQITNEGYDEITLEAQGSGQLTLRDRMMPGWEARVDGKAADLSEGTWRTVGLGGPGHHTVQFIYRPPGLRNGVMLSLLGIVLLVVAGVIVFGKRSRASPAGV